MIVMGDLNANVGSDHTLLAYVNRSLAAVIMMVRGLWISAASSSVVHCSSTEPTMKSL